MQSILEGWRRWLVTMVESGVAAPLFPLSVYPGSDIVGSCKTESLLMSDIFSGSTPEKAKWLENFLLSACEGNREDSHSYELLRAEFVENPKLKPLLPEFVRTCRDLRHFWTYIRNISPHWEPRRKHVRDAFTALFEQIEQANSSPVDSITSNVLTAFDVGGVHAVWAKALDRRHSDAEGAITSARTLLESVCKRVLDEAGEIYDDAADLPALYKQVAKKLRL